MADALLGPVGLLFAALLVIAAAVRRPPLWYTPAAYDAMKAERDQAREIGNEWKATAQKWEKMALHLGGVVERQTGVVERAVRPESTP